MRNRGKIFPGEMIFAYSSQSTHITAFHPFDK